MARVLLPHFVFLWIPGTEAESVRDDEQNLKVYQNAMKLFNGERCKHNFFKIASFKQLIEVLDQHTRRENENWYGNQYKPVFVLTGHGQKNTGFMRFMDRGDGSLVPRRLVNSWRPQVPCDFISTQCYANNFLDYIANPCLLQLDSVRWIPVTDTAKPIATEIYTQQSGGRVLDAFHVQLTALLETYLVSYPELIEPNKTQYNIVRDAFYRLKASIERQLSPPVPTPPLLPPPLVPDPDPFPVTVTNPSPSPANDINPYYIIIFLLLLGSFVGTHILVILLFIYHIVLPMIDLKKLGIIVFISFITGIPLWFIYFSVITFYLTRSIKK